MFQENSQNKPHLRHDWDYAEILELFKCPFNDLIFTAQNIHRTYCLLCYYNSFSTE